MSNRRRMRCCLLICCSAALGLPLVPSAALAGSPAPSGAPEQHREIPNLERQLAGMRAEVVALQGQIPFLEQEIQQLEVNIGQLEWMINQLAISLTDLLSMRINLANALKSKLASEISWADSELVRWQTANPYGPAPNQTSAPRGARVSGGLAQNGLTGPGWGRPDPGVIAAAALLARSFPNTQGNPAIHRPAAWTPADLSNHFNPFRSEHRPVGNRSTSPVLMRTMLHGYRTSLTRLTGEVDTEVTRLQSQVVEARSKVEQCKAKIVECKKKIDETKKKIEEEKRKLHYSARVNDRT